jgi:hypothetical protein
MSVPLDVSVAVLDEDHHHVDMVVDFFANRLTPDSILAIKYIHLLDGVTYLNERLRGTFGAKEMSSELLHNILDHASFHSQLA